MSLELYMPLIFAIVVLHVFFHKGAYYVNATDLIWE